MKSSVGDVQTKGSKSTLFSSAAAKSRQSNIFLTNNGNKSNASNPLCKFAPFTILRVPYCNFTLVNKQKNNRTSFKPIPKSPQNDPLKDFSNQDRIVFKQTSYPQPRAVSPEVPETTVRSGENISATSPKPGSSIAVSNLQSHSISAHYQNIQKSSASNICGDADEKISQMLTDIETMKGKIREESMVLWDCSAQRCELLSK
jgi:hypothetical protein